MSQTQTQKFRVTVEPVEGGWSLNVRNRAGREWRNVEVQGCPGNCAEDAMLLEEYLNDGPGKLRNPEQWVQVKVPAAVNQRFIDEMAGGTREAPRHRRGANRLATRAARRGAAA